MEHRVSAVFVVAAVTLFLLFGVTSGVLDAVQTQAMNAICLEWTAANASTLPTWNCSDSGNPCSWEGIYCASGGAAVDRITLVGNVLNATIPPAIGNLSGLTYLSLFGNKFKGTIPPEIGKLVNLTVLGFGIQDFTGSIPLELGNLTKLTQMSIKSIPKISGTIPPEITNLTQLSRFELYDCNFTGSIPPDFGNMSKLGYLDLSQNFLGGPIPPELGKLSLLTGLVLGINYFLNGTIPPELGQLGNLTRDLISNNLTGPIPPELGNLSKLQYMSLWSNPLNGTIPPEIGKLSQLMDFDIVDTHIGGTLPPELANCSNLDTLNIEATQISGTIPPEYGNLTKMFSMKLAYTQLGGTIPSELASMTSLAIITTSLTDLYGEWPFTTNISGCYKDQTRLCTNVTKNVTCSGQPIILCSDLPPPPPPLCNRSIAPAGPYEWVCLNNTWTLSTNGITVLSNYLRITVPVILLGNVTLNQSTVSVSNTLLVNGSLLLTEGAELNVSSGQVTIEGDLNVSSVSTVSYSDSAPSLVVNGCASFNGTLVLDLNSTSTAQTVEIMRYSCRSGGFSSITIKSGENTVDCAEAIPQYAQSSLTVLVRVHPLCHETTDASTNSILLTFALLICLMSLI